MQNWTAAMIRGESNIRLQDVQVLPSYDSFRKCNFLFLVNAVQFFYLYSACDGEGWLQEFYKNPEPDPWTSNSSRKSSILKARNLEQDQVVMGGWGGSSCWWQVRERRELVALTHTGYVQINYSSAVWFSGAGQQREVGGPNKKSMRVDMKVKLKWKKNIKCGAEFTALAIFPNWMPVKCFR